MPTLHAAPTLRALPDGDVKAPDDWLDDREVFLILRRHAQLVQRPATPRTRLGERGIVGRIDPCGNRATRPAPIPPTGPSPRLPAAALGSILRERRGLPETGPPRGGQLLREAFTPTLPPVTIARDARHLLAQAREVPLLSLDQIVAVVAGRARALIGHAIFMADSPKKYKYKIVGLGMSPAK